MDILIAGGGIGGLAAALALERFGHQVWVAEQAGQIQEVGAGLQISPNGMRVLDALGVSARVMRDAYRPEGIEMRIGRNGRIVFDIPLRNAGMGHWGAEYIQMHRADLIEALKDMLIERAPDALLMGRKLTGYKREGEKTRVTFETGEMMDVDLLVGADGIHSVVREQMLGADEARFTGNVAWRATVPMSDLSSPPPPTACAWVGRKRHAVTYRVRRGSVANFVGVVERRDWKIESWAEQGDRADALKDFRKWHPSILEMIEKAPVLYRWALFDRPKLARWHDGHAVLLGDSCHPMLPFLAQGAVMAIEDAYVLAQCLSNVSVSLEHRLDMYESLRKPRASRVQQSARDNAKLFHRAGPLGRLTTFTPMRMGAKVAPRFVRSRLDWLYGFDVTAQSG